MLDVLSRLGFSPALDGEGDAATLRLIVPTWRSDVTLPADVVEEVARVIGYETLPERLPIGQTAPVQRDPIYAMQRAVRSVLTGAGGWETVTYVAISDDDLRRLDPEGEQSAGVHQVDFSALVRLRNPLQADRGVLRPTLLPSLLAVAAENLKHEDGVRLFETARVYLPPAMNCHARRTSGDGLCRPAGAIGTIQRRWQRGAGLLRSQGDDRGADRATRSQRKRVPRHRFRRAPSGPGGGAFRRRRSDRDLGELRPDRAQAFGIEAPRVAVAEIDLDALREVAHPIPANVSVPRFLPVEQDFAIVVAEETPAASVEAALRAGAGPLATAVTLFDIYRGPQIGENRKSLAYRVTFTAPDRALTDAELGKVRDRIARSLQKIGGELRA